MRPRYMTLEYRLHSQCACGSAGAKFALSGSRRNYERARPFTVRHLALDLMLDIPGRAVSGTARLQIERITPDAAELALDALGFELQRVQLDSNRGRTTPRWDYDGQTIFIRVPVRAKSFQVEVQYRARPLDGLYFITPDEEVRDRPEQVWSQCQDEHAHHWFPCLDKPHVKMTTELRIAVPPGMMAISNGELVASKRPTGKRGLWTFHYRMNDPHPSYLVTLVVGHFAEVSDRDAEPPGSGGRIPVRYFVPEGRKQDALRSLGRTPQMIEFFSRLTGVPFPWSRYSQIVVSDFIFGGMENTTATTLYEHALVDERASIDISSHDLVAHELAHQWFGNYVTCRDWPHAWLNEGFATFFEHLEREERLGRDEYFFSLGVDLDAYLAEADRRYVRPIVCREYSEPIELFDRHLYQKGALVLHMLRFRLGDELFWKGVHRYLDAHGGQIVETNDLVRALEEVSGSSLEEFFEQWVYGKGHPLLNVKTSWDRGQLWVQVKQTQAAREGRYFALDIAVDIGTADGKVRRIAKAISAATDTLVVPLAERPAWVAFDPELTVLGRVHFEAPPAMLRRQLREGTTARHRSCAAVALRSHADLPTVKALESVLSDLNESWIVRSACADTLGHVRGQESGAALLRHADTAHPRVRRAIAGALGNFRTQEAMKSLTALARRDQSYLVAAEAARALGRTRQKPALPALLGLLKNESWADVWRAGALDGLAALRDEKALGRVMEHTRYGMPSRGRRAAIAALPRLSDAREVRLHLEDLLDDGDPLLRIAVVNALETMGDPRSHKSLRERLDHESDGRVARRLREALRDLGGSAGAERKRMADDLETLRSELTEIKLRLSKLEPPKGSARRAAGRNPKKRASRVRSKG